MFTIISIINYCSSNVHFINFTVYVNLNRHAHHTSRPPILLTISCVPQQTHPLFCDAAMLRAKVHAACCCGYCCFTACLLAMLSMYTHIQLYIRYTVKWYTFPPHSDAAVDSRPTSHQISQPSLSQATMRNGYLTGVMFTRMRADIHTRKTFLTGLHTIPSCPYTHDGGVLYVRVR